MGKRTIQVQVINILIGQELLKLGRETVKRRICKVCLLKIRLTAYMLINNNKQFTTALENL